jgi:AraC-like DNA-binding protein
MESLGIEKHWRVKELAARLGISERTVKRIFIDRPGVRGFGSHESTPDRRRYVTRLIPESVVRQYLMEIER